MTGFFQVGSEDQGKLRQWVVRVHKVLAQIRRLQASETKPGILEFEKLRKHYSDDEIERVVVWFELHAKDRYTPAVFSAKSFVAKFAQIKEAVKRTSSDHVEVSPDAIWVSKAAGGLFWPGNEKEQELRAIQTLLGEYDAFVNRLKQLKLTWNARDAGLIDFYLNTSPTRKDIALGRLLEAHRMAWEWGGWAGNRLDSVMRLDRSWFRSMFTGYIREYRGFGYYDELVDMLLEAGVEDQQNTGR